MLEIIFLGHASLLVRGEGSLLCDPIFGPSVSGGGNLINPPRAIALDRLEQVEGVLLTHHHSDHFDLRELARVPWLAEKPFIVPAGSSIVIELRRHGYDNIQEVTPGERIHLAGIDITATGSNVPFPEVGYYFERGDGRILNLADTVFHDSLDSLCETVKHPALVLAPFQSGGYMSLLPLRIGGVPRGLEEAIELWSSRYLEELCRDLAMLNPLAVVPFADGICYQDEGINYWHFPLPDTDFSDAMRTYGCPVELPTPGCLYRVDASQITSVDSGLVRQIGPAVSRVFDPSTRLSDTPLPCPGSEKFGEENCLTNALPRLADNLNTYVTLMIATAKDHELLKSLFEQWELELCHGDSTECSNIQMDLSDGMASVQLRSSQEQRPYGIRVHWNDIARVLAGDMPLEYIELSGAFRYKCPYAIDDLESIRHRVLWPLQVLITPNSAPPPL